MQTLHSWRPAGLTSKPFGAASSPPFLPFLALGMAPGISPSRDSITTNTRPVAVEEKIQ